MGTNNMKKYLVIFICLFLYGCASVSAHISINRNFDKDTTFLIPKSNDPIGVAKVISKEISRRGYSVQVLEESMLEIKNTTQSKDILIDYSYTSTYDAFHYTLTKFDMKLLDRNNYEVIAAVNFSGASPKSYAGIVQGALKQLFNKAKIK